MPSEVSTRGITGMNELTTLMGQSSSIRYGPFDAVTFTLKSCRFHSRTSSSLFSRSLLSENRGKSKWLILSLCLILPEALVSSWIEFAPPLSFALSASHFSKKKRTASAILVRHSGACWLLQPLRSACEPECGHCCNGEPHYSP